MKKELQDVCDNVLAQLREKDKQNKTGSTVMSFELSAEENCREAELLVKEIARLEQEEIDYLTEYKVDNMGWNEA